ncbi:MAG: type II secretion system protein [Wolinella sp.]
MENRIGHRLAFSMIELVFIIVIVGLLASIAMPKISVNRESAKMVVAKQDLEEMFDAIHHNLMRHGESPLFEYTLQTLEEQAKKKGALWNINIGNEQIISKITASGFDDGGYPCAQLFLEDEAGETESIGRKLTMVVYGDDKTVAHGSNCRAFRRLFSQDSNRSYGGDYLQQRTHLNGVNIDAEVMGQR